MKQMIVNIVAIAVIIIGGFSLIQAMPAQAQASNATLADSCTVIINGHAITISGPDCHRTAGGCTCTD